MAESGNRPGLPASFDRSRAQGDLSDHLPRSASLEPRRAPPVPCGRLPADCHSPRVLSRRHRPRGRVIPRSGALMDARALKALELLPLANLYRLVEAPQAPAASALAHVGWEELRGLVMQ